MASVGKGELGQLSPGPTGVEGAKYSIMEGGGEE